MDFVSGLWNKAKDKFWGWANEKAGFDVHSLFSSSQPSSQTSGTNNGPQQPGQNDVQGPDSGDDGDDPHQDAPHSPPLPGQPPKHEEHGEKGFNIFGALLAAIAALVKAISSIFSGFGSGPSGDTHDSGGTSPDSSDAGGTGNGKTKSPGLLAGLGATITGGISDAWHGVQHYVGDGVRSWASNHGWVAPEATAQTIIDAAKKHGVDPTLALTVSGVESHWNAGAVNNAPHSKASGLFQFIPSTWLGMGMGGLNPLSAENNADAGARLLAKNAEDLGHFLGRKATNAEIYATNMFGLAGVEKLMQGGTGMTARDALMHAGTREAVVDDAIRNNLSADYKRQHPDWANNIRTMSAADMLGNAEGIYASKENPIASANAAILARNGAAPQPPQQQPQQPQPQLVAKNTPAAPPQPTSQQPQGHRPNLRALVAASEVQVPPPHVSDSKKGKPLPMPSSKPGIASEEPAA